MEHLDLTTTAHPQVKHDAAGRPTVRAHATAAKRRRFGRLTRRFLLPARAVYDIQERFATRQGEERRGEG